MSEDILTALSEWAKSGAPGPHLLARRAIAEIEALRSLCGKARVGDSYEDATKDLRHSSGDEAA